MRRPIGHCWSTWRDWGRGAWIAAGVGSVGVVFYLATFALGTNLTVVAQSLPGEWWRVPVLVLAALLTICTASALISIVKLARLEPGIVFR